MENLFSNKYQDDILGTNSCFDRVVLKGSLIPISYEKGLIARKEVDEVFKKHNLNPYIIIEATNAETIKQYVEKGIGIAIIPKAAIEEEHKPYLEVIPISHFFNKSCYGVIIKKGKYITTWTKKFLSMLNPGWKTEMEIK